MSSFFQDLTNESTIDADFVNVDGQMDITDATIIGSLIPDEDNVYDIGDATHKWANIYFGILNTDVIDNATPNVDLTLQATHGVAHVKVNDDLDVVGNLEVQGTTEYFLDATFDQNVDILGTLHVDAIESRSNDVNLKLSGNGTGIVEVLDYLKTPAIELTNPTNQIIIQPNDAGNFTIIRANGNPTVSRTLDLPDHDNGVFLIDTGNQVINGNTTFNGIIYTNDSIQAISGTNLNLTTVNPSDQINLGRNTVQSATYSFTTDTLKADYINPRNAGDLTLIAPSGLVLVDDMLRTSFGNGLSLTSQAFPLRTTSIYTRNAAPANRSYYVPEVTSGADFVMTESAQTINGTKTFDRIDANQVIIKGTSPGSPGLYFENSVSFTTKILAAATTANRTITIPEPGSGSAAFVLNLGDQFISGQKEFTQAVYLNNASHALAFGTSISSIPKTYIDHVAPSVDRTISIQDAGANSNFVLSEGAMTINGVKTLTGANIHSGVNTFSNTTNSSSSSTGAVIVNGGAAINKSIYVGTTSTAEGIYFNNNTTSYTPAILNYFERSTFNIQFTCRGGTSASLVATFERKGSRVSIVVPNFTFTSGTSGTNPNVIIATGLIPARIRCTQARLEVGSYTNTDFAVQNTGPIHVTSGGNMEIYKTSAVPNWNTSQTVGLPYSICITYIIT